MKKKIIAVVFSIFLTVTISFSIYGIDRFSEKDFVNLNSQENKVKIAEKVLKDIGRESYIADTDIRTVRTTKGDIDGDGIDDIIIVLDFGPELSVIAVYKGSEDGTYTYLGEIGPLTGIVAFEAKRLAAESRDIIAIKEESIQRLGAYENNVFVRGYLWNGDKFINIISLPEKIEAYWNSIWDNKDGINRWNWIEQNSVISWEGTENPVIYTEEMQKYYMSEYTENKSVPDENSFNLVDSRTIKQVFKWNDEFKAFVIGIAEDMDTKEKFGVVEDFDNSVYYPIPEYEQFLEKVRVIDKKGDLSVKNKNELNFITG